MTPVHRNYYVYPLLGTRAGRPRGWPVPPSAIVFHPQVRSGHDGNVADPGPRPRDYRITQNVWRASNGMRIKTEHSCCVEIICTNTAVKFPRSTEFPRCAVVKGKDPSWPAPRPAPLTRWRPWIFKFCMRATAALGNVEERASRRKGLRGGKGRRFPKRLFFQKTPIFREMSGPCARYVAIRVVRQGWQGISAKAAGPDRSSAGLLVLASWRTTWRNGFGRYA